MPPPCGRSATTVPPCASATWRTIARPRPEPGSPRAVRRAVEAVEDVRQVVVGDARAVVAHGQLAVARRATSTAPPGGLHLAALSSRLETARSSRRGTPRTSDSARARSRTRRRAGCARVRSIASAATSVEPDVLAARCGVRLASRASSTRSATSARQLVELLDDVAQQLLALVRRQRARRARAPRCSCAGS